MVSKRVLELVTLEAGGAFLGDDKVQGVAKRRDGEVRARRLFEDKVVLVPRHGEAGKAEGLVWVTWQGAGSPRPLFWAVSSRFQSAVPFLNLPLEMRT